MRFLFVALTMFAFSNVFSQQKAATWCGMQCPALKIELSKRTDRGVRNSTVIDITNNLAETIKIKVFVKTEEGQWVDLGESDPVKKKKVYTFHYNRNDMSEDYVVYYINYPSDEKFPALSDLSKKAE